MKESLKVLIVDDEPINLGLIEEMLDGRCETSLASSGEIALEKAEFSAPDLVLLDVMMPGIDGYETCKKLRETPGLAALKIVMISANDTPDDIEKGLESGADEYVSKPFDEDTLLGVIDRYM